MNAEIKVVSKHADYLRDVMVARPRTLIAKFKEITKGIEFDTLVGTGLSGALAVPLLARAVKCHFAIVRKKGDGTHSVFPVEGTVGRRWIFVDDLVCSGDTLHRVRAAMNDFCEKNDWKTKYVGDYLYYRPHFRPGE